MSFLREHRGSVDLDRWLDDPVLRTRHRREAAATPAALWAAAETVRLRDCRVLGRLVPARIPGVDAGLTFGELFRDPPFTPLEEGRTHALSGLCGRIWTLRGDFAPLRGPADFEGWSEPGTVRVLFANWTEASARGAALVSEVRIGAVDRRAARYVRALEPFIAAFQGFVATEPLRIAVQRVTAGR
jgi:hypothetical protein